jgi:hypothetical protein
MQSADLAPHCPLSSVQVEEEAGWGGEEEEADAEQAEAELEQAPAGGEEAASAGSSRLEQDPGWPSGAIVSPQEATSWDHPQLAAAETGSPDAAKAFAEAAEWPQQHVTEQQQLGHSPDGRDPPLEEAAAWGQAGSDEWPVDGATAAQQAASDWQTSAADWMPDAAAEEASGWVEEQQWTPAEAGAEPASAWQQEQEAAAATGWPADPEAAAAAEAAAAEVAAWGQQQTAQGWEGAEAEPEPSPAQVAAEWGQAEDEWPAQNEWQQQGEQGHSAAEWQQQGAADAAESWQPQAEADNGWLEQPPPAVAADSGRNGGVLEQGGSGWQGGDDLATSFEEVPLGGGAAASAGWEQRGHQAPLDWGTAGDAPAAAAGGGGFAWGSPGAAGGRQPQRQEGWGDFGDEDLA